MKISTSHEKHLGSDLPERRISL